MLMAMSVDHLNSCGLYTIIDFLYPCFDLLKAQSSLCTTIIVVSVNVENILAGA